MLVDDCNFLGPNTSFIDVQKKSQIAAFLDTKVKPPKQDPEKKWITTYNHCLRRIKLFHRWLYNQRGKDGRLALFALQVDTGATEQKVGGKDIGVPCALGNP